MVSKRLMKVLTDKSAPTGWKQEEWEFLLSMTNGGVFHARLLARVVDQKLLLMRERLYQYLPPTLRENWSKVSRDARIVAVVMADHACEVSAPMMLLT